MAVFAAVRVSPYDLAKALSRLRLYGEVTAPLGPRADYPCDGGTCLAYCGAFGAALFPAMLTEAFRESAALGQAAPAEAVAALAYALMDMKTGLSPQGPVVYWPAIQVAEQV